jgi:hypothetical protein
MPVARVKHTIDALLFAFMAASVCASWPPVARAILLTTKIAIYYCLTIR